jgi:hypothetical protein
MSAIISCCGRYRYRLEREIGMDGRTFAYFGINPSTADAQLDDATVRKWIGFTKVNGGRRFIVGNAFAFRSTDVGALRYAENPVGTRNASFIAKIIADADVLVPCWGDGTKVSEPLRKRLDELADRLLCSGKPVKVFGFTKSGDPKHPLMLGYDTPLIAWETRERPRIRR